MRRGLAIVLALMTTMTLSAQKNAIIAGPTLRAAYLATNPAQAVRDPASGELRGVAVDMARELARRLGVEAALVAAPSPQAVMDAVRDGKADVGFVAYNPERAGPVEFSQPYLLVNQTFLVRADSPIRSVREIDRSDVRIGARAGDSIALYLARTLKQARLVELADADTPAGPAMVQGATLDAFGANRQRLTDILRTTTGLRLLPDDLYGVEQAIVVPRGRAEALTVLNQFIDEVRRSGFIQASIARSGVVGIAVAPGASR